MSSTLIEKSEEQQTPKQNSPATQYNQDYVRLFQTFDSTDYPSISIGGNKNDFSENDSEFGQCANGAIFTISNWRVFQQQDIADLLKGLSQHALLIKELRVTLTLGILKESEILPVCHAIAQLLSLYYKSITELHLRESDGSFYQSETHSIKQKQTIEVMNCIIPFLKTPQTIANLKKLSIYIIFGDSAKLAVVVDLEKAIKELQALKNLDIRYNFSKVYYNTDAQNVLFANFVNKKVFIEQQNSGNLDNNNNSNKQCKDSLCGLKVSLLGQSEPFFASIFASFIRFLESLESLTSLETNFGCIDWKKESNKGIQKQFAESVQKMKLSTLGIKVQDNAMFDIISPPVFSNNFKYLNELSIGEVFTDIQHHNVALGLQQLAFLQIFKYAYLCSNALNLIELARALQSLSCLIEVDIAIKKGNISNQLLVQQKYLDLHSNFIAALLSSKDTLQKLCLSFLSPPQEQPVFIMVEAYVTFLVEKLFLFPLLLDVRLNDDTDKIPHLKLNKDMQFSILKKLLNIREAQLTTLYLARKYVLENKIVNRYFKFKELIAEFDFSTF